MSANLRSRSLILGALALSAHQREIWAALTKALNTWHKEIKMSWNILLLMSAKFLKVFWSSQKEHSSSDVHNIEIYPSSYITVKVTLFSHHKKCFFLIIIRCVARPKVSKYVNKGASEMYWKVFENLKEDIFWYINLQ